MGRSQIFRDFVDTSESRSFEYTALLDGQVRLGSYQRVRGFDLVVIVGREKAEVLEVWWQETRTHFIWLVATLVVIVWLGLRLTRQIADRLQAERRLAAANDELVRINLTDALTGIANRRGFDQALLHEWSRASRSGTQMALLMIDVDSFKSFNDVYGHPEGDLCLQTIATVLEQAVRRPGDVTARYGGEEFSAILPDTDEHGAVVVATNIRETLARLAINHVGAAAGCVTVSIGIAVLAPSNDVSPTVLLKLADARLYQAKEEGRDRIVCSGDCKTEAHQLALTA